MADKYIMSVGRQHLQTNRELFRTLTSSCAVLPRRCLFWMNFLVLRVLVIWYAQYLLNVLSSVVVVVSEKQDVQRISLSTFYVFSVYSNIPARFSKVSKVFAGLKNHFKYSAAIHLNLAFYYDFKIRKCKFVAKCHA